MADDVAAMPPPPPAAAPPPASADEAGAKAPRNFTALPEVKPDLNRICTASALLPLAKLPTVSSSISCGHECECMV